MKISVITVTYNSEKFLHRNIESVNKQTYKNLEHIFIDGMSGDSTVEIMKMSKRDSKVVSEKDYGIYDAMNKGIDLSSGDIICFLNSDDFYMDENILERVASKFRESNCKILTSNIIFIDESGNPNRMYRSVGFRRWMFKFGYMPAHPGTFFSRSIIQKVGQFKTDFQISSDFDYMLRAYEIVNQKEICELDKISVSMNHGGISTKSFVSNLIITREMHKSLKINKQYANYLLLLMRLPIKFFDKLIFRLKNITK